MSIQYHIHLPYGWTEKVFTAQFFWLMIWRCNLVYFDLHFGTFLIGQVSSHLTNILRRWDWYHFPWPQRASFWAIFPAASVVQVPVGRPQLCKLGQFSDSLDYIGSYTFEPVWFFFFTQCAKNKASSATNSQNSFWSFLLGRGWGNLLRDVYWNSTAVYHLDWQRGCNRVMQDSYSKTAVSYNISTFSFKSLQEGN